MSGCSKSFSNLPTAGIVLIRMQSMVTILPLQPDSAHRYWTLKDWQHVKPLHSLQVLHARKEKKCALRHSPDSVAEVT